MTADKKKSKTFWAVLILLIIVSIPITYYFWINMMVAKMNAMYCEKLPNQEFDQELTKLEHADIYVPKDKANAFPLTLDFNLPSSGLDQTVFSIFSESLKKYVYVGPYKENLPLLIEKNFYLKPSEVTNLPYEGADSVTFRFLDKKSKTLCIAAQETLSPIWVTNAKVHVNFLPEKEMDEKEGVPVVYKTRVEK